MNNLVLTNSIRFIVLVLLQVLVLNKLQLFGFISPMVYIVWILLFPLSKNKGLFLVISFLLGLSVDFFSDSGGIHAGASVLIAFIRLPILNAVLRKSDFDYQLFDIRAISFSKAFVYIAILTTIHHLFVFSLEYLSLEAFYLIIKNTFFTSLLTIIISILGIVLFKKKK